MLELTGKKIMVTGASSGIGQATAILISKLGGTVVACGRNETRLDETLSACEGHGHIKLAFDVRDIDNYGKYFDQAVSDGKKLDGLVYSAGISDPTPIRVMDVSMIRDTLEINLVAFMMMVSFYSKKKYNDEGSIIAVSSMGAYYPFNGHGAYVASKGAIEAVVKTFAVELLDKGIRINSVCPGDVLTPMTERSLVNRDKVWLQSEDVANTIVFLLSDMAKKSTGRTICIDGVGGTSKR